MLYRGTKPGALYKGAYKPGKLYKGTQLVAGYKDVAKAAPASWDGTYDDVMGVAAQGRGKQDGTPTPSAPVPLVASEGSLTASGRAGTTPTTVTLPVLRAIPGTDIRDTLAHIGGGQWQVTRRVGVIHLTGTENWYIGGSSYQASQSVASTGSVGKCDTYQWVFDRGGAGMYVTGRVVVLGAAAAAPYGSLDEWKTYLAERYDKDDPLTLWVQLATPTTETVTLGSVPSYPVHTELAISGDFPPDVTGTVKVSL